MTPVIIDKMPQFKRSLFSVLDDAMKEGARDTLIVARTRAPFDKGQLRAESDTRRTEPLKWRVSFWKEYARFQEFGGDASKRVRNYGTAGTGAHYLRSAGDEQVKKMNLVIKKHAQRARA